MSNINIIETYRHMQLSEVYRSEYIFSLFYILILLISSNPTDAFWLEISAIFWLLGCWMAHRKINAINKQANDSYDNIV